MGKTKPEPFNQEQGEPGRSSSSNLRFGAFPKVPRAIHRLGRRRSLTFDLRPMWHNVLKIASVAGCFFLTACGPDYVKRYDKPLTYAQAAKEKDIGFPLPASSHHIYYAMYADWQAYTRMVRFQAPVEDCVKHMATAVAWDDKMYNRTSSYPRLTVSSVAPVGAGYLDPVPWFTPQSIVNGLYTGANDSHTPEIWVDLDRGIFYFKEHD